MMTESSENQEHIIGNVGGYVIKVGNVFVGGYRRGFLSFSKNLPSYLVPRLSDVQEVLHDKYRAQSIAKDVNGKVYQICVEPVEED